MSNREHLQVQIDALDRAIKAIETSMFEAERSGTNKTWIGLEYARTFLVAESCELHARLAALDALSAIGGRPSTSS